jgi:prepilin-type N-terminal cleavage/methylation domain-containing protein
MTLASEDLLIMNIQNNYKDRIKDKSTNSEQGFSLIETMIALTTLGVCLAYAMPLFLYAKINNSKSEVRAGALFVAQRVFDDIRSKPVSGMPLFDGKNNSNLTGCTNLPTLTNCKNAVDTNTGITPTTSSNPEIKPNVLDITTANVDNTVIKSSGNKISSADSLLTNAFGRQYQTKVTYCEDLNPISAPSSPPNPPICSERNRKFKVEVSYNGSKVYDLEGTYTDFQ